MRLSLLHLILAPLTLAAGPREEHFRYEINWPTGLSLGEAHLRSSRDTGRWNLEFELDASIPAFKVLDRYKSVVNESFCGIEFEKEWEHGPRKGKEKSTFSDGKGIRKTLPGGGTTEFAVGPCVRDALGFLFQVREEVARGRLPNLQKMYFGASYDVRVQFKGVEKVNISQVPTETDRLHVTVTGAASKVEFDLYLARDEARTPAMVRVPFPLGVFSMELVR